MTHTHTKKKKKKKKNKERKMNSTERNQFRKKETRRKEQHGSSDSTNLKKDVSDLYADIKFVSHLEADITALALKMLFFGYYKIAKKFNMWSWCLQRRISN